jgi:hypothetical protein
MTATKIFGFGTPQLPVLACGVRSKWLAKRYGQTMLLTQLQTQLPTATNPKDATHIETVG